MEKNEIRNKILKTLLKQFTINWTITALAEELKASRVGIWKTLKKLDAEKSIFLTPVGKGKTSTINIHLNWENPLLEKKLSLILTEEALKNQRWINTFEELENKTDFLIIYGSILHSPKEANDIDILEVISNKKNFQKIEKILQKIQKTQIKKIHSENLTKKEFKNEIKKQNRIFIDAIKKGIILFGQEKFIKFIKDLSKQ